MKNPTEVNPKQINLGFFAIVPEEGRFPTPNRMFKVRFIQFSARRVPFYYRDL